MKKRGGRLTKSWASGLLIWILWSQEFGIGPGDQEIKNKPFVPHDTFDTKADCLRTGKQKTQELGQTWRSINYGPGARVTFSEDALTVSILIDKLFLGSRYYCFPSNFDPRGPKG